MLINLNRRYSNGNCEEIGQEGHEEVRRQASGRQEVGSQAPGSEEVGCEASCRQEVGEEGREASGEEGCEEAHGEEGRQAQDGAQEHGQEGREEKGASEKGCEEEGASEEGCQEVGEEGCEKVFWQKGCESTCCQAGGIQRAGGPCGSDNPEPASGLAFPDGEQALTGEAPEKPGTSVPGFLFLPSQPPMCQAVQAWTDAHPHP
jgi:hypothetical protein